MLPEFLRRYPDLAVQLRLSDEFLDLIEEGIDVAIRIAHLEDSSLVARPLATVRRVICASPSYLERHGVPRTPEDLGAHNCLTVRGQSSLNEWTLEGERGAVRTRVRGNFESNSSEALVHAALAGMGLIRMSTFLVGPELERGRLVQVLEQYTQATTSISLVYPHRRHPSAKVRAFVEFMSELYAPPPSWAEPRRITA